MRHQKRISMTYAKMTSNTKKYPHICISETLQKRQSACWMAIFKQTLLGVDSTFQMHLWDRLLPQAECMLNIMQPMNIASTISAHLYVNGQCTFNKMLLVPMLHNKLDIQKSWDAHATEDFYIETSCQVWAKETQSVWIADTFFFKYKYIRMPTVSKADVIFPAMTSLA